MYFYHISLLSALYNAFSIIFIILIAFESGNCTEVEYPDSILQLFPQQVHPSPIEPDQISNDDENNVAAENGNTIGTVHPPYSSSPIYLTSLAQAEQVAYAALTNYENSLRERLQILERYRIDYEDSVISAQRQSGTTESDSWTKASAVSSHPLLAYRMIRRFARDLNAFTEHLWKNLENELWESLENARGNLEWPSEQDLTSVTKSLIRLQDTYDFNLELLIDGAIPNYPVLVGLTAGQTLEVSEMALAIGDITAATEWFRAAHTKAVHGQYNNPYQNFVPMDDLTAAWEKTYNAFRSIWPMTVFKTHDVFAEAKALLREDFNRLKAIQTFEHRNVNFRALCRGDKLKSEAELSRLICFHDRIYHPYLYLHTIKVEIHNWSPLIYEVHEFLGTRTFQEISADVVSSLVSQVESGGAIPLPEQELTSFTHSWLLEDSAPALARISEELTALTGFIDEALEPANYHVAAYAVGNHYEPCTDCTQFKLRNEDLNSTGIKTKATVHVVLHEPEQGGELAFTLTGTLVKHTRGSLIIYNNQNPTTKEPDERILHGSCPVLIGQKWIATKVISTFL